VKSRRLHVGVSGNVLINKDADRVNSFRVWNYAEGHDSYYASMLVDLTLPPDEVSDVLFRNPKSGHVGLNDVIHPPRTCTHNVGQLCKPKLNSPL